MSLTGGVFLTFVLLLALGLTVGTVVFWPALAANKVPAIIGRTVALGVSNVAMLLVAAVLLNNHFGFFADWTDLAGAVGAAPPQKTATGGAAPSKVFAPGPIDRPTLPPGGKPTTLPPLPPGIGPDGRTLRFTVTGPASQLTGEVLVHLPASYRKDPHRAYPVIETFSGYPGSVGQWLGVMKLPTHLDNAVAGGQIGQAIIVSPVLEFPPGTDSECVDAGPGRQVETWTAQDVPAWVQQHFRVLPDPRAWATIGLSAGGWCAAMVTMLHPQQFGGAVVMGGYFKPSFEQAARFSPTSPQAQRYDLVRLARTAPPRVAMWLETSHRDSVSYSSSKALLSAARSPMSVTAVVLPHAGHRINIWEALVPQALVWLGRTMPGFAPGFVGQA